MNLRINSQNKKNQMKIHRSHKFLDLSKVKEQCAEFACEFCDNHDIKKCVSCKGGYFLSDHKCFAICPYDQVADIYTRTCRALDSTSKIKK